MARGEPRLASPTAHLSRDTSTIDRPIALTVQDIAAELRCSDDDVRALIRAGELRTVACGIRPGRVPRHELEAYQRRIAHRPA